MAMTDEEWLDHWMAKAPPLTEEQADELLVLLDLTPVE